MKKITLYKKEKWMIKERIFKVLDVIYKETYVVFILENWNKQVVSNFENFIESDI